MLWSDEDGKRQDFSWIGCLPGGCLSGRLVSELPLSPLRLQCAQSVQGHCRKKEHIRVQHPAPGAVGSHWNMFPRKQRDMPGTRCSSAFGGLREETMQPKPPGTPVK